MLWEVRKSSARVDKANREIFTVRHHMIINGDAVHWNPKRTPSIQSRPPNILLYVALAVVPAQLRVATILSETQAERAFGDQAARVHNVVNRRVEVGPAALHHTQNSVGRLRIEQVGLPLHTAERVHERVLVWISISPNIHRVLNYVAIIVGALRVPLVELALMPVCTRARIPLTV